MINVCGLIKKNILQDGEIDKRTIVALISLVCPVSRILKYSRANPKTIESGKSVFASKIISDTKKSRWMKINNISFEEGVFKVEQAKKT